MHNSLNTFRGLQYAMYSQVHLMEHGIISVSWPGLHLTFEHLEPFSLALCMSTLQLKCERRTLHLSNVGRVCTH